MGEFLDEFVERHKNIGPVAVTEKELVIYLVLLQFQRFLFHGDEKGFALRVCVRVQGTRTLIYQLSVRYANAYIPIKRSVRERLYH